MPATSSSAPGKKKAAGGGGEGLPEQRMMELQEEAAREKAGRERAEAQVATWKSEARLMRDKAMAMEQSRNDLVAKIQVSGREREREREDPTLDNSNVCLAGEAGSSRSKPRIAERLVPSKAPGPDSSHRLILPLPVHVPAPTFPTILCRSVPPR